MALATGTRLGAYEIIDELGVGGMGEVYRATDTTLDREVAVKVLPESFASDAGRIARFEQEAKTLAALNHAHIAQIYGLERAEGRTAIVMELIEGPTLADRIEQGPLPPDQTLSIAMQIADALEAAHERGIVHRDLKPANIKVKDDGTVKVLDFGIAKAFEPLGTTSGAPSPVMTTPVTQTGIILGTAAYMSPEQARGKPLDRRTDIWAFGCVLYEMLTGQPAFGGEDVAVTLARIIAHGADTESLPGTISPAVRHTIELCLKKDPRRRLADISDVRLGLEGLLESDVTSNVPVRAARPVWQRLLPAAAAAAVAAAITFIALGRGEPVPPREITRSIHTLPDEQSLGQQNVPLIALSPDGRQLVYSANGALYLRRLSELESRLVPGTDGENPIVPDFSPDGHWIVYGSIADGQLKRVAVEGGTPLPIMQEWPAGGWRWPLDDFIYYGLGAVVGRIAAAGGQPEVLFEEPGYTHFEPRPLPGDEYLIFERRAQSSPDQAEIAVRSLSTGETTALFPGKQAQFLAPGYLVYFEPTLGLMARTFDPSTLAYGSPIALADDILMLASTGGVQFRVSPDGDLVYIQGQVAASGAGILVLASESAPIRRLDVAPRNYSFPSVSPAGDQVAVQVGGGDDAEIFVYDLSGEREIRQLTFEGSNRQPAWTPDGQWISYSSNRDGTWRIYRQRADGSGVAEPLTQPSEGEAHSLPVWTPNGEQLAYVVNDGDGADIWIVGIPDGTPELLVGGEGTQGGLAFSPDGDAFAYASNASGTLAVLAEPFPPDGSRTRLSEEGTGSLWPVWSRDGTRLSYQVTGGGFSAIDVILPGFGIRNRRSLPFNGLPIQRRLDSVPNGDQMLLTVSETVGESGGSSSPKIVIVENWVEELKQRLPID